MYIGLISDTHGVFDAPFRDFLEPVDQIWHAGDFGGGLTLAAVIAQFKPLVGVAGNCDNFNLRYEHPIHRFFECEGMKVLMTHIGGYPGKYDRNALQLIDSAICLEVGAAVASNESNTQAAPSITTNSIEEDYDKQGTALLSLIKNTEKRIERINTD